MLVALLRRTSPLPHRTPQDVRAGVAIERRVLESLHEQRHLFGSELDRFSQRGGRLHPLT